MTVNPTVSSSVTPPSESSFVSLINGERSKRGLNPLTSSVLLYKDAVINNGIQLVRGMGHFYMGKAWGQCAAWGATSEEQVFNLWMNSKPHQDIMMGHYSTFGLARARSYWTLNVR